ncbi:hypothetical protein PMI11_01610 [Rhizobium sp. CF142]|nr:hypothetical protein PMI11_01610 [Rhizobium sp. CF142]
MAETTARQGRSPHMEYGCTGGDVNAATLLFMAAATEARFSF